MCFIIFFFLVEIVIYLQALKIKIIIKKKKKERKKINNENTQKI